MNFIKGRKVCTDHEDLEQSQQIVGRELSEAELGLITGGAGSKSQPPPKVKKKSSGDPEIIDPFKDSGGCKC